MTTYTVEYKIKLNKPSGTWESLPVIGAGVIQADDSTMAAVYAEYFGRLILSQLKPEFTNAEIRWNFEGSPQGHYFVSRVPGDQPIGYNYVPTIYTPMHFINRTTKRGGQRPGAGRKSSGKPKSKPLYCGDLTVGERDTILKSLSPDQRKAALLTAVLRLSAPDHQDYN